ncbi:MFS transporter [Streptomyces sp. NPDC014894]|uniref:MFS transporter n=1 Tax=unclassified Streptomyces TaxID=2593676 RepID=UPI0036F5B44B
MKPPTPETATEPEHPAQRRILTVLVVAQMLSGAALAAGITIGALLAEEMLGATGLAGVPSALFAAGAAGGAVTIGRACRRWGRRPGLALGYGAGALGSLGVVAATAFDSVALLFLGLLAYGAGTASIMLARYAGADLASPARRARAVSTVLFATAAGAIAGPALAGVSGDLAESWGIDRLAGPFLLALAAFAAAALVVAVFLRPDPLLLSRPAAAADLGQAAGSGRPAATGTASADRRGLFIGTTVMVLSQLVMIGIMTMTPVHMTGHGHSTGTAGLVIGVHLGAMYLSSPLSGALADRVGRLFTAALAALTLFAAGMLASFAPGDSALALAAALVLLGVGWNLGFVAGTAMITDALPAEGRASAQGLVDVGISVAGAAGGLASGLVVAVSGYPVLALCGGLLVLALLPVSALAAALPQPPSPPLSPARAPAAADEPLPDRRAG